MGFNLKSTIGFNRLWTVVPFASIFLCILCVTFFLPLLVPVGLASEGGVSSYTPGTYGDFAMNILPPGFSVRENVMYYEGKLKSYPAATEGIGLLLDLKLDTRINILQAAYATRSKILGGRYLATISIPYVFDAELGVSGYTLLGPFELGDDSKGLGDIQVVPFGLLWDKENFHILLAENIVVPTGDYGADELVSIGRNYWSYETIIGVTWLHPKRGHEISVSLAYMINMENPETDYKTGDEFHVDYTLAQYFSESFAIGLVGYYYTQTTDDSGAGYDNLQSLFPSPILASSPGDLNGVRGEGGGIGPAVMWSPKIGGRSLNIIFKWMNEYNCSNRTEGIWYNLSAVMIF